MREITVQLPEDFGGTKVRLQWGHGMTEPFVDIQESGQDGWEDVRAMGGTVTASIGPRNTSDRYSVQRMALGL